MNLPWDFLEIVTLALLALGAAFVRTLTTRINNLETDAVELKTKVAVGGQLHHDILHRLERIENILETMRKI